MPDEPGATESSERDIDPRLHYANERTFLAWIRTALALVTAGLVITQLLPGFKWTGGRRLVGIPLIVLGTFLAVAAFRQWDANERAMHEHEPLPPSHLAVILAGGVAIVAAVAVVLASTGSVGK
jgi:putative membrane protein